MFRRICRALAVAALLVGAGPEGATSAPAFTSIQDVLYKADVTRFNGKLRITLDGSTVTFVNAATPQPGDTRLASYRLNETQPIKRLLLTAGAMQRVREPT
jgi:hypothetical protein